MPLRYGESAGYLRALDGFQSEVDRSRNMRRQDQESARRDELYRQSGLRFQREQDQYATQDALNQQRLETGQLQLQGLRRQDAAGEALQPGAIGLGLAQQQDQLEQARSGASDRAVSRDGANTRLAISKLALAQAQDESRFIADNRKLLDTGKKAEAVEQLRSRQATNFNRSIGAMRLDPTGKTTAQMLNSDSTNGVTTAYDVKVEKGPDGDDYYVVYDEQGGVVSAADPLEPGSQQVELRINKRAADKLSGDDPETSKWLKLSDTSLFNQSTGEIRDVGDELGVKSRAGALNADQRGTFKIGENVISKFYGGSFNSVTQEFTVPESNREDFAQALAIYEQMMNEDFARPAVKARQAIQQLKEAGAQNDARDPEATSSFFGLSDEEAQAINSQRPDFKSDLSKRYGLDDMGGTSGIAPGAPGTDGVNELGTLVVTSDGQQLSLPRATVEAIKGAGLTPGQSITFDANAGALAGRTFELEQSGTLREVPDNGR